MRATVCGQAVSQGWHWGLSRTLTVLLQDLPELTTQRGQREKGERRQQSKSAGPRLDLEVM